MPRAADPLAAIADQAGAMPDVTESTSCNQRAFKVGKNAFLYLGPGPKGQGFKAMFKLERSRARAAELAETQPDRFGVGSTSWVTARFTAEKPLPKSIWAKGLKESYDLSAPRR